MIFTTTNPVRGGIALVCLAWLLAGTACKTQVKPVPEEKITKGAETLDDVDFLQWLSRQPLVRSEDAYRAVLLLKNGQSTPGDFAALQAQAEQEGLTNWQFKMEPGHAVDNGQVAFMLCKAIKQVGGINWCLTGLVRYAYREMVYQEVMVKDRAEYQHITGGEMVDAIGKADAIMQRRGLYPSPGPAPSLVGPGPGQAPGTGAEPPDVR